MVNDYQIKTAINSIPELDFFYKKEDNSIRNRADNSFICSFETYSKNYRKLTGQSFDCIYYCGGTLEEVLQCTECGTVIFSTEDYERYDPHLRCPTCTGYETYFEFWTKEDIEKDHEKQKTIELFKWLKNEEKETRELQKKRKGLTHWEIGKRTFCGKKRYIEVILECNDIRKSYLKGLRLHIRIGRKDRPDDLGYTIYHTIRIPLSWSQFYIQFIYTHLGKCSPDLRSKFYIGKPIEKLDDK